jgi:hypothetical protein
MECWTSHRLVGSIVIAYIGECGSPQPAWENSSLSEWIAVELK